MLSLQIELLQVESDRQKTISQFNALINGQTLHEYL